MNQGLILNKSQAEAVYRAMVELNNVGALIRVEMNRGDLSVQQHHRSGRVTITSLEGLPVGRYFESYADQQTFAQAYGIDQPTGVQP